MTYSSIADFRSRSDHDEQQKLVDFILASPKRSKSLPSEDYQFSYTSAVKFLEEQGFSLKTRSRSSNASSEPAIKPFVIRTDGSSTSTQKSVFLQDDVIDRLNTIAKTGSMYTLKQVINTLLDEALKLHGV